MVLGCTLAESMAWAANRQQLPFTFLDNLSLASSLLSQWSLGGWGGGLSLGSSSWCHCGGVPGKHPSLLQGWL